MNPQNTGKEKAPKYIWGRTIQNDDKAKGIMQFIGKTSPFNWMTEEDFFKSLKQYIKSIRKTNETK